MSSTENSGAAMLTVGDIDIYWLRGGRFRLDGGAMFGPVPKPLWARRFPCDEHNSIPMQAYPVLVSTRQHRLLIDTGLGDKLTDKQLTEFAAGIASGHALAKMLPKDLHWSEESALVFRLPKPARPAR